jgi:hypothetical protein
MDELLPHKNFSLEDMDGEIWKDIEGYEGYYQISSFGRVKSFSRLVLNGFRNRNTTKKIRKPKFDRGGYTEVCIKFNNKSIQYRIHRLVALHFIDNPNNKAEVNHLDSNRLNNNVKNLEWASKRENQCYANINRKKTSKYVGVCFYEGKKSNYWRSKIQINNKHIYLGSFQTELEAYQARCDYEKANNIENKYL